jgi:hypothetical protein
MEKEDIEKLFKKREGLINKLAYYNDPPMFNTQNYEPHKKRIRERLWKISDFLHKELDVDKRYGAF